MISFFTPRYLKESNAILKNTHKLLCYKRDILPPAIVAEIVKEMRTLETAVKARDQAAVEACAENFETLYSKHFPPHKEAGWRENCEVFLVAIVIALGVRTYFIQPFTIPTGSMQPTLNGIVGHETTKPAPNFFVRMAELAWFGRTYVEVVAHSDGRVLELEESNFLNFFTVTDIRCEHETHRVWAPRATLIQYFHIDPAREYHPGEAIIRGYVATGDHVFVDKMSYNFRNPKRGEVFVFKTTDIARIEDDLRRKGVEGSQFYIKRLAGVPGDNLRVDPPTLYVNGERAHGFGFERVMSGTEKDPNDGYRGYGNGPTYLRDAENSFTLPSQSYFAMGDNSYNSFDSRYWGTVPEQNIAGHGLFVYWPFGAHWGFIR
ncbi:MAG: signal peptidase I [Verrucomicrobiota bacterium]